MILHLFARLFIQASSPGIFASNDYQVIMNVENIYTDRLILIPYTKKIATEILNGRYEILFNMGLNLDSGWPDAIEMETVPRILKNLEKVNEPTGFETWMIILKNGKKIIGSAGFKGIPNEEGSIDIGYGVISQEQKKGYALEAVTALICWAFTKPGVKKITARCLLNNINSAKLLEKSKFMETSRDEEMIYWKLEKRDSTPVSNN